MAGKQNEAPDPNAFTDPSPCPSSDADLATLGAVLRELGVKQVIVHYNGCGDSGCTDEVAYRPKRVRLAGWVEDKLREVAEAYCPDGYENNEGGHGSLTIYPFEDLASLAHYDRYEDGESYGARSFPVPDDLRERLAQRGVTAVTAHFDGYGDSGQIDSITTEPESIALGRELQDTVDDFLTEQLPAGWMDNQGGYGDFTVEVASGRVVLDGYWRVEQDSDVQ